MSLVLASVDGAVSDPERATIPVGDEGLLRGDGVFEVARVYDGRVFAREDHLRRMAESASNLRLEIDLSAIAGDVDALLAERPGFDGQVRFLVTRGGRRIVLLEEPKEHGETCTLLTVEFAPVRLLDGVKSLSYAATMLATRIAKDEGADEALLCTPHGRVLEAPTSSFFYVLGGALHTPPLSDHILDSITRRRVVELTGAQERITTRDDLREMEEAFLASTTREVQAVASIDGRALPAAPGDVTRSAASAFRAHVEQALSA